MPLILKEHRSKDQIDRHEKGEMDRIKKELGAPPRTREIVIPKGDLKNPLVPSRDWKKWKEEWDPSDAKRTFLEPTLWEGETARKPPLVFGPKGGDLMHGIRGATDSFPLDQFVVPNMEKHGGTDDDIGAILTPDSSDPLAEEFKEGGALNFSYDEWKDAMKSALKQEGYKLDDSGNFPDSYYKKHTNQSEIHDLARKYLERNLFLNFSLKEAKAKKEDPEIVSNWLDSYQQKWNRAQGLAVPYKGGTAVGEKRETIKYGR